MLRSSRQPSRNDVITVTEDGSTVRVGLGEDQVFVRADDVSALLGKGDDVVRIFGDDAFFEGGSGADRVVLARGEGALGNAGRGADRAIVLADDGTLDLGGGDDFIHASGDGTVVTAGIGDDRLFGGAEADSLWGFVGNDVIRTGAGSDYALGGAGNDLTDTGEGLGIHFGGTGRDTFFIGSEIVGNDAVDTIVALDFGNGRDSLEIAPEVLAAVATAEGGRVDIAPVLAAFEAEGLGVAEVGERLGLTRGGARAFDEVADFLAKFEPDARGRILVDATTVTTTEGDTIIALGVAPDDLLAAIG